MASKPCSPPASPRKLNHPIDQGWAWVICGATFVASAAVGGFSRTTGIFYIGISETYMNAGSSLNWVTSMFNFISYLSAPLGILFCTKFGPRISLTISTCCATIGLIICSFSSRYEVYFFSYSVLAGCHQGITMTTCLNILEKYFLKRISFAVGIMLSGGSVGALIIPKLIQYMDDVYGFQNMLLLLAGIYMHLFIVAALFTPIEVFGTGPTPLSKSTSKVDGIDMDSLSKIDKDIVDEKIAKTENEGALSKYIKFDLLRDANFYILTQSFTFNMMVYIGIYFLIPVYAKHIGLSSRIRADFIFYMAFPDLITRILSGWIADLNNSPQKTIFGFFMIMQGVLFLVISFIPTYTSLLVFSILEAICAGFAWTLMPAILRTTLGHENMSSATGLALFYQGLALMILIPSIGKIKDLSGGYSWPCRMISILALCSTLTILFVPLVEMIRAKRKCTEISKDGMQEKEKIDLPSV